MRRGQVQSLGLMILTIIAIGAVLSILIPLLELGEDRSPVSICRTSLQSRLSSSIATSECSDDGSNCVEVSWAPVLCNTVDSILYPDKGIWTWLQKTFDKDGADLLMKEKAMHMVAEKMVECRYMMNEARQDDYFTSVEDEAFQVLGWNSDDPHCFLCATVSLSEFVDSDNNENMVIDSWEMHEFISSEESPRMGIKYIDYLQGGGLFGGETVFMIQEPIRNEDVMAILYFSKNHYEPPDYLMDGAKLIGAIGVAQLGIAITTYSVVSAGAAAAATGGSAIAAGAGACATGVGCIVGAVLIVGGIAAVWYYGSKIENNIEVDAKTEFYNGDLMTQRYYSYIVLDSLTGANNAGCQVETYAEKFS
jgi:hypothetical protein